MERANPGQGGRIDIDPPFFDAAVRVTDLRALVFEKYTVVRRVASRFT